MENDLFNLFKYMNFSPAKPMDFMAQMVRQYEIGVLQVLAGMIDDRLKELTGSSRQQAAPSYTKGDLNPFSILGVSVDATEAEVKAAYRKKAAQHHPDRGGSSEQMVKINAAYEVICRFRGWSK
jgi:DnaJ-class molecular chaperone